MKKPTPNLLQNLIYAIIWLTVFALPLVAYEQLEDTSWSWLWLFWVRIIPFFVLFVINNYLLIPRLMLRRKWVWYVSSVAVAVFVLFSVIHPLVIHNRLEPLIQRETVEFRPPAYDRRMPPPENIRAEVPFPDRDKPPHGRPPGQMLIMVNDWLIAILIVGFNIAIRYLFKSIRDERQIRELEAHNLQSELNYLKAQINPHFFMNTLNNIHALIDIDSERAKASVIELSKIMRYVLYEADMSEIALAKEVVFIENYVNLMRIRFSDEIDIRMEFPSPRPDVKVPPMLLMTLVENAFKHGISHRSDPFIHIRMTLSGGRLVYTVENSIGETGDGKSGVGMENLKKRLTLLFGEVGYTLAIDRSPEKYTAKLEIPVQ